jgi:hypothetical protein
MYSVVKDQEQKVPNKAELPFQPVWLLKEVLPVPEFRLFRPQSKLVEMTGVEPATP